MEMQHTDWVPKPFLLKLRLEFRDTERIDPLGPCYFKLCTWPIPPVYDSMFPSYLDNTQPPETQPSRPALKGNVSPWIGSQNQAPPQAPSWLGLVSVPLHEWVTLQGNTTEAREDPTGGTRQGKDDGKKEGTSTEIYFLQKRVERNDFRT